MFRRTTADEHECGCHIAMVMNGAHSLGHRMVFCLQHDPVFCQYVDYYDGRCERMAHTGDEHWNRHRDLRPPGWEPQ